MISVEDVAVTLGGHPVLEGASLSVEPGELLGLVGPNGAGKTTLLRTIAGTLAPDAGRVTVDGDAVADLSSKAVSRRVAVVPQDTTLAFDFPVEEVVAMGRTPYRSRFGARTPADREHVADAIERTGIGHLRDRSITEVSGGERQRVVVARAVAQDTPALLLDEPTASLDVNHQVETLELVRNLTTEGRAALAAIHDLSLAARYCDRLAVLADGGILACGPPEEVLTEERLADAFDARAVVTRDPVTGAPQVTALAPGADRADGDAAGHVHVVGEGRVATALLTRLDAAGYWVTAGPLAPGGTRETAADLGVETVALGPYEHPGGATRDAVLQRVRAADATVLADLDVGPGTGPVLDAVVAAESPVVVEERPLAERTHGDDASAAVERYRSVREAGTVVSPAAADRAVRDAVTRAAQATTPDP